MRLIHFLSSPFSRSDDHQAMIESHEAEKSSEQLERYCAAIDTEEMLHLFALARFHEQPLTAFGFDSRRERNL